MENNSDTVNNENLPESAADTLTVASNLSPKDNMQNIPPTYSSQCEEQKAYDEQMSECSSFWDDSCSYLSNIWDVLTSRGHRLLGVYLLINMAFATWIVGSFLASFMNGSEWALLVALILYLIYLWLMMSPLGEKYLRFSCGCTPIKRHEDIEFITPIFLETLEKARAVDPRIPQDIRIFISESLEPNAFAVGRKTVCLTRGIIQDKNISQAELEAVLAHEFGHIAHKDTDILILLTAGNIILDLFFKFLRVVAVIFTAISIFIMGLVGAALQDGRGRDASDLGGGVGYGLGKLVQCFLNGLIALWYWFSNVCVMRASRKDEFQADEFSFNLGYGSALCAFLDYLDRRSHADEDPGPRDFFAFLMSSHPPIEDRIAHLQDMGATFSRYENER